MVRFWPKVREALESCEEKPPCTVRVRMPLPSMVVGADPVTVRGRLRVQLALLVMVPARMKDPLTPSVTAPFRVTSRSVALLEWLTRLPETVRFEKLGPSAMIRPE